ncbi:MAG: TonB-dependent receptor, partial [Bacteroidales bacterium]|nr:TonB-dependent receptor [Bacteroidales bacterium]
MQLKFFFKKSPLCAIVCFLLPFMFCTAAVAQNVVEQNDTLVSAVVTAAAKPSPAVQSAPLQVIEKDDFSRLGIKELHEAVKTFSGVQIKDYGGIGGVKTVSVRSLGTQHTAVSYDGVTISNAQSGQIDIGRFNLDNVELVTLSIGQTDDIFQSARMFASAGVLNIKTSEPLFDEGKNFNAGGAMRVSSFATYNPAVYYNQKVGEKWSFAVNADWLVSDGEYPYTLVNSNTVTEHTRENSDVDTKRVEANIYGDLAGGGKLVFKGNWMSSQRGLPGSVIYYNTDATERLWDEAGFVQAHYRKSYGKWDLQGQIKCNYSWNKYTNTGEQFHNGVRTDYFTQKEYYGSISARYNVTKGLSAVISQDVFRSSLDASYENCLYPRRNTSLTAVAAKFTNGRVNATASLLYTYITEDIRTGKAAADRKRLSPAASISYKPFKGENLRIRASYQDIFRTPTFNDLYYDRVGNAALNPEIARQMNVGITWRKGLQKVLDEISLQADFFYNRVEDKIVGLPTLFVWRMLNMGEVDIKGADINLGTSMWLARDLRMELQGNYSYQKAIDVSDPQSKNYRHQIPYTPLHSGSMQLSLISGWGTLGYMMQSVGERFSLPQNIKENLMEG